LIVVSSGGEVLGYRNHCQRYRNEISFSIKSSAENEVTL